MRMESFDGGATASAPPMPDEAAMMTAFFMRQARGLAVRGVAAREFAGSASTSMCRRTKGDSRAHYVPCSKGAVVALIVT